MAKPRAVHARVSCIKTGAAGRGMHQNNRGADASCFGSSALLITTRCLQQPSLPRPPQSIHGKRGQLSSAISHPPHPRSCVQRRRRRMTCAASASCDNRWSYLPCDDMSASELRKLAQTRRDQHHHKQQRIPRYMTDVPVPLFLSQ